MLRAEVNYPLIDIKATEKAIHKEMTRFLLDEALTTFVTQSTEPIPVWSGASRASFLKLASKAKTSIEISPVVASRIPLGIGTSEGEVIAKPGKEYGWLWSSDLAYIGIVDENNNFQDTGIRALDKLQPVLPDLVLKK